MASKFWAHESGASGSESDSDSDSDSSMGGGGGAAGARRQWAVDSDSESEEEVRRGAPWNRTAWERGEAREGGRERQAKHRLVSGGGTDDLSTYFDRGGGGGRTPSVRCTRENSDGPSVGLDSGWFFVVHYLSSKWLKAGKIILSTRCPSLDGLGGKKSKRLSYICPTEEMATKTDLEMNGEDFRSPVSTKLVLPAPFHPFFVGHQSKLH